MVRYYYYNKRKIIEQSEFQCGSIVELVTPTQNEIVDIARLLNITEQDIISLYMGNFDKIECENILAAKFNSSLNVMIDSELNHMIICRATPDNFDKECAEWIHSLWGAVLFSDAIDIDESDIRMIFEGAHAGYMNSICESAENKTDVGTPVLSSELVNAIDKSKKVLFVITASRNVEFPDVDKVITKVRKQISDESSIIFAAIFDDESNDKIHVTIITPAL